MDIWELIPTTGNHSSPLKLIETPKLTTNNDVACMRKALDKPRLFYPTSSGLSASLGRELRLSLLFPM